MSSPKVQESAVLRSSSLDAYEHGYQQPVFEDDGQPNTPSKREKPGYDSKAAYIVLLVFCGVAALGFTNINMHSAGGASSGTYTSFSAMTGKDMRPTPNDAFSVVATNEYGPYEGQYTFFDKFPGSQLIEPMKMTTLSVQGQFASRTEYKFRWFLEGREEVEPYEGSEITFKATGKPGIYGLQVDVYKTHGDAYIASYNTHIVKYVKRELRSLSTADREKVLDAAITLWQVPMGVGKKKFGDKYTSMETLVAEHAKASSDIRCDHDHEGSGFLTHHLAL
jgi:hypothetical protein